jgi:HK97 family phage portal protein
MISGNAFILAVGPDNKEPQELHILRPDRVSIIAGNQSIPKGYCYEAGNDEKIFYPVNNVNGKCKILHLRNFNPLDDYYGLSPIEAASYSIDQHNQAAIWNQSLLQNGARPSGAIVVKPDNEGFSGNLSEIQYNRLKEQIDTSFRGPANSGRPMLLEGGLEWKEMSLTPKDMDFIEAKNSAARDIALAFGVPPQLLGIPGDNTYSNMQEARIGLWEETILPMMDHMLDALNKWLVPLYGNDYQLTYDRDSISILASRRESIWQRIENSTFMTINEKRNAVGLSPIDGGDSINKY